ncbi:MAG TPA: lysylphosphatidylglycerol synthase domain-containing protein [Candidatus Binataceae bacterium]|nr:lysylphosphatidylglycerol synthase domain-containing protein [Candidatus Binataceae bacterium]
MRRLQTLIILLSVGFYVWFLSRFGLSDVARYLHYAGWGLAFTISLEAVARIANTVGWRLTIIKYPSNLSFGELFVARISGEAIDYVTPSAQLGGQFVMAMMVRAKLAMAVGLATVVIASLAEALGQIGFVAGGLLFGLQLEAAMHHFFWPAIAGLGVAIALAAGFFFIQMKRPFSQLWRLAAKLDVPQIADPELVAAAGEADARLIDFYQHHRGRLLASCFCYLIAWALGPIEIFIYLRLLHQPATWTIAILVEALGLLIERATFLIPAKLISQEGGKALILSMLGYPADAGFAIGLLRRIKEMVWVGFGLAGLTAHRMVAERPRDTAAAEAMLRMRDAQRGESI